MSAEPARIQLGELLVQKGVLTDAQLEIALAEQRQSGAPLGEIVVRLGFAQGATIANALADQHGGPLRTEYGLAMGPTGGAPLTLADRPNTREQDTAIMRLKVALDEKTRELERVSAELTEARQATPVVAEPPADQHVLFVPGPSGYLMIDQAGQVPVVGARLEHEGTAYTVRAAGPSTFLGVPISCALLAPAQEAA